MLDFLAYMPCLNREYTRRRDTAPLDIPENSEGKGLKNETGQSPKCLMQNKNHEGGANTLKDTDGTYTVLYSCT